VPMVACCCSTPIAATVFWWPLRSPSASLTAGRRRRRAALAPSGVLANVEHVAELVADPPGEISNSSALAGVPYRYAGRRGGPRSGRPSLGTYARVASDIFERLSVRDVFGGGVSGVLLPLAA
jgi:hypothetical protein